MPSTVTGISVGTGTGTSSSGSTAKMKEILMQALKGHRAESLVLSNLIGEEICATHTMKILTARFGTRGKSAKSIFLQGFKDEVKSKTSALHESTSQVLDQKASKEDTGKIIYRPAAMVLYSQFCIRLEMLIKNQLFHLGLVPPPMETPWLYDEAGKNVKKVNQINDLDNSDKAFIVTPVEELLDEPEEKMLLRLKIYKRALGALILHCEALRPLLREIKRSYDSMLKLRERQIQETTWMTQNIVTADREMQEKTQNITFEGQEVIKLMDSQCKLLMRHIDKQDAAIRIMTDILNKLENALGEEHEFRRDSDDQNKLFVKDINEIRKKLGMQPRVEENVDQVAVEEARSEEEEEKKPQHEFNYTPDDPLILRKALEICRHDLHQANTMLEQMEEEHKEEIPRHLQEQMKQDLESLKQDHEKLKLKKEDMASQVSGIKNQIEKLTTERDDLKTVATDLRVKITPRPSWEKVGEFVEGGVAKWKSIYEGKTSVEISNKVIEELNAKKTAAPPEYLSALGEDPDIPRCLRHETRVRDRRLSRRDAEVIIHDIWTTRIKQLKEVSESKDTSMAVAAIDDFDDYNDVPLLTDFPEFVAQYFEEKFLSVTRRMEWTYNLVDACKRLTMNSKLTQFMGILMGKTDERCYHMMKQEIETFQRYLQRKSQELNAGHGKITLGDFRRLIEELYPYKSETEVKTLLRVTAKQAHAHAEWTFLKYEDLFNETDEGFDSNFVDEFFKQMEFDKENYVHEIVTALLLDLSIHYDYQNHEEETAGETDIHIKHLYKALVAVDPDITEPTVVAALSWVYLRTSILPGMSPRGSLLITYIQTRLGTEHVMDAAVDQAEFDQAVHEIREGFHKLPEESEAAKGKKKAGGHGNVAKSVKLRVLIRRLKEGAMARDTKKGKTPPQYPDEYGGEGEEYYYWGETEEDEEEEEEEET